MTETFYEWLERNGLKTANVKPQAIEVAIRALWDEIQTLKDNKK